MIRIFGSFTKASTTAAAVARQRSSHSKLASSSSSSIIYTPSSSSTLNSSRRCLSFLSQWSAGSKSKGAEEVEVDMDSSDDAIAKLGLKNSFSKRANNKYDVGNLYNPLALPRDSQMPIQFLNQFQAPPQSSAYDVNEGAYVKVEASDIEKYIPEGCAGEVAEEFGFSLKRSWMIREPSKLLFRILDDFLISSKSPSTVDKNALMDWKTQSYGTNPEYDGLTNRKEWSDSVMRVFKYGKELTRPQTKALDKNLVVLKGEGSVIEGLMGQLKSGVGSGGGKASDAQPATPRKIMLTGPRGVGKSIILNQTVIYARKRGWLTMYIPNGWEHSNGGHFVEPCYKSEDPTLYDNQLLSVSALRNFYKAHGDIISKMPLKANKESKLMEKYMPLIEKYRAQWADLNAYRARSAGTFIAQRALIEGEDCFPQEDAKDKDILASYDLAKIELKTVGDLIRLGVAFRDTAGSVFLELVDELKECTDFPVLIVSDQVNSWDTNSSFGNEKGAIVGRDLCVPRALSFLTLKKSQSEGVTLKNGIYIGSTGHRYNEGRKITYEVEKASIPLMIRVPSYSQIEFLGAISYYIFQNRITNYMSPSELIAYRTFTGSNPRLIREESVGYFTNKVAMKTMGEKFNLVDRHQLMSDIEGLMRNKSNPEIDMSLRLGSELGDEESSGNSNKNRLDYETEMNYFRDKIEAFYEDEDEGVDDRFRTGDEQGSNLTLEEFGSGGGEEKE